jgi:hypothetical protein
VGWHERSGRYGLQSLRENSLFEGDGLQAVHSAIKMNRLQKSLRAALASKSRALGAKARRGLGSNVRAEARTFKSEVSCTSEALIHSTLVTARVNPCPSYGGFPQPFWL